MIAAGSLGRHLRRREPVRDDLGVDAGLAHAAGDQLGVLGAEVDDEDGVALEFGGEFGNVFVARVQATDGRQAVCCSTAFLIGVVLSVAPVIGRAAHAATDPTVPPITANPFLPDDRGISECISALPKPGCGSEERGGWHQGLILLALVGGLSVIGWRIVAGASATVRSRRALAPPRPGRRPHGARPEAVDRRARQRRRHCRTPRTGIERSR